jgi:hypothetical protein
MLLVWTCACERQVMEPCAQTTARPIVDISAAEGVASQASIPSLFLHDITRDGLPIDTTALRGSLRRNAQVESGGLSCNVPCGFGEEPGTYRFGVRAHGFYGSAVQVAAEYSAVPAECPASHGTPTRVALALVEADSARVSFGFVKRSAVDVQPGVSITFDDGSGVTTFDLTRPWPTFETRNAGTLRVRVVMGAPDTIAVGELELPLQKDWHWSISAYLYDSNPAAFCVQARSFPLRRAVAGADSLYLGWAGNYLSRPFIC